MYQALFFRLSQKKKKRVIAGPANLDLSGVANLGTIKCKLTSVYLITWNFRDAKKNPEIKVTRTLSVANITWREN